MSKSTKENIRLMIIDDDPDDRMFFIEAVKEVDENIECSWAKNGIEALQKLRNEALPLPDYIFLDLRMPGISGKKCLLEIKSDARLKDIPVIIYSTSRELEESQELQELGAVHFISKPSQPEEIYYVVACVLEEQIWQSGGTGS